MFYDLYLSSNAIWASVALAPIWCFIFIAIMSAFAETIAWVCVALVQIGLIGGAVGCWLYRGTLTEAFDQTTAKLVVTGPKAKDGDKYIYGKEKDKYDTQMTWLLWGTIGFGCLAGIFACCVVCGFKSLKLAIDVIDASADFLFKTKRVVVVPIVYFIITLIVVFVWMGMFFCVVSMNKIEPSKFPQVKDITISSEFNYWSLWYMAFALIWLVSFI